jgi:capsular exopolysaccharide synthesis family protein
MSRFFNETRKASRHASPGTVDIDIHERVGKLKELFGPPRHPSESAGELQNSQARAAADESAALAAQLVASRLENCRKIILPCGEEKSLLMRQYNLSLQHALEAYHTLRVRLVRHQTRQGMNSLVISSADPGDGKTLTTFNLSLCLAKIQNWPVLLVDGDLRTKGMSEMLGDPQSPGLAKILEGECSYESAILSTDVPNLYVLPAGNVATPPPELFSRPTWKDFIGWCSESFKMVLIDSPPTLNLSDFELIAAPCEGVALVVRPRKTMREDLMKTWSRIDRKKFVGFIFNASEEKPEKSYYRYTSVPATQRAT